MIFFISSRRRHTKSLRDWSSDVCSSDLLLLGAHTALWISVRKNSALCGCRSLTSGGMASTRQIGRASCRERVYIVMTDSIPTNDEIDKDIAYLQIFAVN